MFTHIPHAISRGRTGFAALRRLSQSSSVSSCGQPRWLQAILSDSAPPPKPYAWTLANVAHSSKISTSQKHGVSGSNGNRDRIYILGVGNIGRLYAACLANLSHPPPITLVVHRRSLLEQWAAEPGITLTRYGHPERQTNFDIEWWTEEKPPTGPVKEVGEGGRISNLIVATKVPEAITQVDRLRRYLDASSTVVFVQNGVNRLWPPHGGIYNSHRYPGQNHPSFLHAVTMHGVYSEGPFKSVHAAPADVVVGPVHQNERGNEAANHLTKLITTAPHLAARSARSSELWILQLEKLVINMVINPLTAILRVRNGELFSEPEGNLARAMDVILAQTGNVLQALVKHESSEAILRGGETLPESLLERFSVSSLRVMLYRVGELVSANKSSMFQDVEAGKQTEIREFNGWLIETAEFLDQSLDVSAHATLIDLVEGGVRLDKAELARRLLSGVL